LGGERVTYGEFLKICGSFRVQLGDGLKGKRIGIQSQENNINFVALIFALLSLESTPALFSRRLSPSQRMARESEVDLFFDSAQIEKLPRNEGSKEKWTFPEKSEVIFWTSGTSSSPKAAVLEISQFFYNALGSLENIPFVTSDKWLLKLPLEHVGGFSILFRALLTGGSVADCVDETITHISFVPTQLYRFLKEDLVLPRLKCLLIGGGATPLNLIQESEKRKLPLFRSYGLTEMASQVATTTFGNCGLTYSGKVLSYRQVQIKNNVICVKGPCLFKGYLVGDRIISTVDDEGYFVTRDLGEMTAQGDLKVLGRADRMFVSAGENIQPEVIERALLDYPGILQARVVAIDDQEYGLRPTAFVLSEESFNIGPLNYFLRDRLTGLEIPKQILDWSKLPEQFKTAKDL
jgi:O-succinylbenzoic acid--CoA ligase